eukprot:COSAG04_NODE_1653_length_6046_cov_6.955608_5_plen_317_part_00
MEPTGPRKRQKTDRDPSEQAAEAIVAQRLAAGQSSSHLVGVGWAKSKRRWEARIKHEGWDVHLGTFVHEEVAGRAFDDVAWRFRGAKAHGTWKLGGTWRLNYPTAEEAAAVEPAAAEAEAAAQVAEALVAKWWVAGQPTSRYVGVSWNKKGRKWMATIKQDNKLESLGFFVDEEQAARAFDATALRLRRAWGGRAWGGGHVWGGHAPRGPAVPLSVAGKRWWWPPAHHSGPHATSGRALGTKVRSLHHAWQWLLQAHLWSHGHDHVLVEAFRSKSKIVHALATTATDDGTPLLRQRDWSVVAFDRAGRPLWSCAWP